MVSIIKPDYMGYPSMKHLDNNFKIEACPPCFRTKCNSPSVAKELVLHHNTTRKWI